MAKKGRTKGNKICPAGIAWAKRTFDKYPSAYANMYAGAVCSGKVTPGGKKKKKKRDNVKRFTILGTG